MTASRTTIDAALASRIRLVATDVDGVMTDGGIYLGDVKGTPLEFKRYDIQDGIGLVLLREAGIRVVVITGRVSESVRLRAEELRVDDLHQDPDAQKMPALLRILDRHHISLAETAFIGDDIPDLSVLRVVGLPVAVGNAVPEVQHVAKLQLERHGGRGALREFSEKLLHARGQWNGIVERYVADRTIPLPEGTHA